ncbi:MAG TPA: PPOX class F420-dependent oxidoreductase [Mycobacteriales bacterium]|nr:PPOX class F420-dependent oxidoreductase [Mycobacteriales bacterium]
MSEEEWRAFVAEGTRTGKVATTRPDGRPHVAPVWFVLDGADLVFTTGRNTAKGRALTADPRVAICVDDERPPFSFVLIEGTATVSEEPAALLDAAIKLGARYMGADRAEEFGRRNAVPGELLIRVHPDKVIAQAELSG